MDNHVHLVVVPSRSEALARTLRQTHADYARYANVKRRSSGHFWQNRYFSCALDRGHCWRALAYVERNPVRAGMVEEAGDWGWSSARAHLGEADAGRWLDLDGWRVEYSPEQWREVLQTTVAEEAEGSDPGSHANGPAAGRRGLRTGNGAATAASANGGQTWAVAAKRDEG